MSFARKALYFRLGVSLTVFLLVWLILGLFASVFNQEAIVSKIDDTLGTKFLNPRLHGMIITGGWHILAGVTVAVIFFFKAKTLCTDWLSKRLAPHDPIAIRWNHLMTFPDEYLIVLEDGPIISPDPRITNQGHQTIHLSRIEVVASVNRVERLGETNFSTAFTELEPVPGNRDDDLHQWLPVSRFRWKIEERQALAEKDTLPLPPIELHFDCADPAVIQKLTPFAGDDALRLTLQFFITYDETKISLELQAPIRIFPSFDDAAGAIERLAAGLARGDAGKAASTRQQYEQTLADFASMVTQINTATQRATEQQQLLEWAGTLQPYTERLLAFPSDPLAFYDRACFLQDKGLFHQPLQDFQRAASLGLQQPDLSTRIARLYLDLQQWPSALEALTTHPPPDPLTAVFLCTRGEALYWNEQPEAAARDLEECIEKDPDQHTAYIYLALVQLASDSVDPMAVVDLVRRGVAHGYPNRKLITTIGNAVEEPARSTIVALLAEMPAEE